MRNVSSRSSTVLADPATLAALAVVLVSASACQSRSGPHVILHGGDGAVKVAVELALTPTEQAKGLMWRESMPEGHGMLFVFADSRPRSFWMKNTPLPLDIVYIDDGRIVSIAASTTPYSTGPIPSGAPARYVLEVTGGFCERHAITVGARVEIPDAIETAARASS